MQYVNFNSLFSRQLLKLRFHPSVHVTQTAEGDWNYIRVIGVSSYRGSKEKTKRHLIKEVLNFHMFQCKFSSNIRA